jgi:ABC-type dipeptide/oligopeptide/nickel transport system ATPase component
MKKLQIINIKKIEKLTLDIPDNARMLAFIGKNGTGKSTIGQVIRNLLSVKNFIEEPIQKGKETGQAIYTGTDSNGNEIRIEWEIGKEFESFHAYLKDGPKVKVISEPGKIRQLIGSYFSLTAQEALGMMKYAETRRKFIEDYILKTMPDEALAKFQEMSNRISDKKNKATEGNLFHTRTDINKEIAGIQAQIEAIKNLLTPEMKQDIEDEKEIREDLEGLKKDLEEAKTIRHKNQFIEDLLEDVAKLNTRFLFAAQEKTLDESYSNTMDDIARKLENEKQAIIDTDTDHELDIDEHIKTLGMRIDNGNKLIWNITTAKESQEKKAPLENRIKELQDSVENINIKINDIKEERAKLLADNLVIPGLEFDEDFNIRLNGFMFDENSVSETEAKIAIVELLSAINTADFIDIGDWSLYDKESRSKLLKIIDKRNQILIGQMVTEDQEVAMEVIMKG